MDFTEVTSFLITHSTDEETGVLTITFTDEADDSAIGEITLEAVRARAFFEALLRVQEARWPNGITRQGHKTVIDINADEARTEFV